MSRVLVCFVIALTCACSDETGDRYTALANQINGSLRALRPTAMAIRKAGMRSEPGAILATVRMCTSMDTPLDALLNQETQFEALQKDWTERNPADYANYITWRPPGLCEGVDVDLLEDCHQLCMEYWTGLDRTVETLRSRARAHGVEIESLR